MASGEVVLGTALIGEEAFGRPPNKGGDRKPPIRTCTPGRDGIDFIGDSSGIGEIIRGMVGKYVSPPPVER